jgi:hypothetical protein
MRYTIVIIGSMCAQFLVSPVLAKHPLNYHHRHLVLQASTPAVDGTSLTLTSSQEHQLYLRNLHDSGYDPRHDVGPSGNVSDPANW